MPAQITASAAADGPGISRWTWEHPLAAVAARTCAQHPTPLPDLIGGVACLPCWEQAIIADLLFAFAHDLPVDLVVDPFYVDEIAVERAMRGDDADLTEIERTEVRRRLAEVRTRRNRAYRFVCSRAATTRREVRP